MALTFIRRSDIPVPIKGKLATVPQVSINENGQMTFSTLAVKNLGGKACTKVAVAYEPDKRRVVVVAKGHKTLEKKAELTGDDSYWDLKHSSKGNSATLSGSGSFLKNLKVFGTESELYRYADSGNQIFPVEIKAEGYVSFTLPKGNLERKQKITRKKRDKTVSISKAPITAPPTTVEEELIETA